MQIFGMDMIPTVPAKPKDWSKPILRFTRAGWRWAYDMRFLSHGAFVGCVAYVGPYASAGQALEEARSFS